MIKTKIYDYSNNILEFGYEYLEPKKSNIKIEALIEDVEDSFIICDTEDFIITKILKNLQPLLNNKDKVFVGLTSDSVLKKIHADSGVKTGFFRSTNEHVKAAVIIINKHDYYIALDETRIYKIKAANEIFEYINYLIWSKSLSEYCQGKLTNVKDVRLSVVKPLLKSGVKATKDHYNLATSDLNGNIQMITKPNNQDSVIINCNLMSAFVDDGFYVNVFEDAYYKIDKDASSIITAKSFKNKKYENYANVSVLLNKDTKILLEDEVIEKIERPLNEYKQYNPDFDSFAKKYTGYTCKLTINIDVLPMKVDNTYSKSSKYKKIAAINQEFEEKMAKIEKLELKDAKKPLERIKKESNLVEKAKLFNEMISKVEIGEKTLLSKQVKPISVKAEDVLVPHELIGILYEKGKSNYLATKESTIDEAIHWLKENKMEATLILNAEED